MEKKVRRRGSKDCGVRNGEGRTRELGVVCVEIREEENGRSENRELCG